MPRILSICGDERLRYTREILLRKTGAEIISADVDAGLQLARQQRFELLIVDYSISMQESIQFGEIFRYRWPGSKILHLSSSMHHDTYRAFCDREIDWTEGPDIFLKVAEELLLLVEQHARGNTPVELTSSSAKQNGTVGKHNSDPESV